MGVFRKDVSTKSEQSAVTIIAEGNRFCGDMNIVGKLHIDGVFEGNISSLDSIFIGKSGHVHGVIRACIVNVCGVLEGEVICEHLHIDASGTVKASVESETMTVDEQGCFIGERRLKEVLELTDKENQIETAEDAIKSLPDKVVLGSNLE